MNAAQPRVAVVGLLGGIPYGEAAAQAIATATVVVGSPRHLDPVEVSAAAETIVLEGALDPIIDAIAVQ